MGIELGRKISQLLKRPERSNLVIRSRSIRSLRRRLIGMIENPDKRKEREEEEGIRLEQFKFGK